MQPGPPTTEDTAFARHAAIPTVHAEGISLRTRGRLPEPFPGSAPAPLRLAGARGGAGRSTNVNGT